MEKLLKINDTLTMDGDLWYKRESYPKPGFYIVKDSITESTDHSRPHIDSIVFVSEDTEDGVLHVMHLKWNEIVYNKIDNFLIDVESE